MIIFPAPQPATRESSSPSARHLQIFVLFNGSKPTTNALRAAAGFAADLGGDILVAAPLLVPYPLPLNRPAADRRVLIEQISDIASASGIGCAIRKVLIAYARDRRDDWLSLLPPRCIVVVGKADRYSLVDQWRAWSTARFLRKQGYEVLAA